MPGMDVVRWVFEDVRTSETYEVEINPNEAGSYRQFKSLDFGSGSDREGDGRPRTFSGHQEPVDWAFGGVIRSKAHHDALLAWSKKKGKVRVTDHLGRTFEVMIASLDVQDRKPTGAVPWRLRYMMNTLLLRRIA